MRLDLRFMLDRLGKPKSSPSSSSYPYSSSPSASSTFQSWLVSDRKWKYDFNGGEDRPEEDFAGGVLACVDRDFWVEETGGVLGLEELLDRFLDHGGRRVVV